MPKEKPFDYNEILTTRQTPFGSRVASGASLQEIRLGLGAGANPFLGVPSALSTSLTGAFVDQRAQITAFLQDSSADYKIPDVLADQAYVWLLQWETQDRPDVAMLQENLLEQVRARSHITPEHHRRLALGAARLVLSRSSVPRDVLKSLLDPLGDLQASEVEWLLPASLDSWPVVKSVLDRVPPSDRLALWEAGVALPDKSATPMAVKGGWVVRFLATAQERPILRLFEYTCSTEWCAQVLSPSTREKRAHLAAHLLCSTEVSGAFNAVKTFPQVAGWLFPGGDVAHAMGEHGGTPWYPVLAGYGSHYAKNHKKNRTDERLDLAVWLLAQPQPALDKADAHGTTAFDAWESLVEQIDDTVAAASVIHVNRAVQLGQQLLALGAANEWADDQQYRRAAAFKHPALRQLQEQASAQERQHRLSLALPAAVPVSARGPRF